MINCGPTLCYFPLEALVEAWPLLAILRLLSETFVPLVSQLLFLVTFGLWVKYCAQGKVAVVHPGRTRASGMEWKKSPSRIAFERFPPKRQ
jgi:hypothetical protein